MSAAAGRSPVSDLDAGSTAPELSIIIVNYKGLRHLERCFQALADVLRVSHEIIFVDNASGDGSVELVRERYPSVRVVENETNLGFAAGNNVGALLARGRYLLLLNNDTALRDDLGPAIALLERESRLGVLGIRMEGVHGEYRRSAGRFPAVFRFIRLSMLYARHDGLGHGNFSDAARWRRVDWVEGSFLLTPRALWERLGGLDEGYFMYVEDIDYCRQVHAAGLAIGYLPSLSYMHAGGYGQGRIGWLTNSLRRYAAKFYRQPLRALALAAINLNLAMKLTGTLVRERLGPRTARERCREEMRRYWQALRGRDSDRAATTCAVPPGPRS
jgi:GT2 family glycosyltransferase